MNLSELLKRAIPAPEPISAGSWGILLLRPDLGSQQEFVVGAAASIDGDQSIHMKWVPSLAKLSKLYGEATTANDLVGLLDGCERSIRSGHACELSNVDCGTPHIRLAVCGYFSADNVERELTQLLKRHASAIWSEPNSLEERMDDDWAYSEMLKALANLQVPESIIVPGRSIIVGRRQFNVAFNNGRSYGNVVSARYTNFSTVERHILLAHVEITAAHNLTGRSHQPALFVILPASNSQDDVAIRKKSVEFLAEIEDSGINQYSDPDPVQLAQAIEEWAAQ